MNKLKTYRLCGALTLRAIDAEIADLQQGIDDQASETALKEMARKRIGELQGYRAEIVADIYPDGEPN